MSVIAHGNERVIYGHGIDDPAAPRDQGQEKQMYTISHYEQGNWIWDGDADEDGATTAHLPDEVYELLDRELEIGERREITADGVRYLVERDA